MEVSVIIPVYNAVDYIDQSIRSALLQPEVKEVIVIDDGSDDGSYEKLKQWDQKEPKLHLLTHPKRGRRRAGASRNLGLQLASTDYVAFLDADDFYATNRFSKTAELFHLHPEAEVILEPVQIISETDDPKIIEDLMFVNNVNQSNSCFESILLDSGSNVAINGICFKREVLKRIGFMDESLHQKQDKDFLLRLCLYANVFLGDKNQAVAYYRHHKSNTTYNLKEEHAYQFSLYSKWKNKLKQVPISFGGKLKFIRQYTVSKYNTRNWSLLKKSFTYPLIISVELFKNLDVFIPSSHKGFSSHSLHFH